MTLEGRVYLERGDPVEIVIQWGSAGQRGPRTCDAAGVQMPRAPKNVLIRRADGTLVSRPFRGLRRP